MVAKFLVTAVLSATAMMLGTAAHAAPPPQYSVEDVAKSFSDTGKAEQGPAAPGGSCESKGKSTGPDGLCYPSNAATAGFNLGRKSAGSPPAQTVAKTQQPQRAAVQKVARTNMQKDLLITFKLGSAELTDQGRANAAVFAKALKVVPQLSTAHFHLAGYTDASGAKDKNLDLSQKRSEAVKAFLVGLGVDGSRLSAQGYGSQNLLPGVPANSPDNRRVVATKE